METQTIGVSEQTRTYKVKIGVNESRFTGTQAQLWAHVDQLMLTANDGALPHVEAIDEAPAVVSAPPATAVTARVQAPTTHREATQSTKNADDTARSSLDLLAAQAAGFAPARPYYDRGTPVIALGVENARASHREWEAQPRLSEAVERFIAHVKSEGRRDQLIDLDKLAMRKDGTITGINGERWLLEPEALAQLASRLKVPSVGFLVNVWPELRAMNWNQLIATSIKHEKSTCPADHPLAKTLDSLQTVRVRLRNTRDCADPSAWAVVSDSYATFDVDQIAASLAHGLARYSDARCEITYDGKNAQFDVLFHSNVNPERYVAGEFFKAGYRVRTNDAGGGGLVVSLLLYQNLCLNLICIDVASFVLARLRHIGDGKVLAHKFLEAVKAGENRIGHFLRAWGFATDDAVCSSKGDRYVPAEHVRLLDELPTGDTFTEAELLAGLFTGLAKSEAVSITKDDITGLVAAHALDTSSAREVVPVTRASVVNAITRYAHETVGRLNPSKQATLESEAGKLLIGSRGGNPAPLPFMPPRKIVKAA